MEVFFVLTHSMNINRKYRLMIKTKGMAKLVIGFVSNKNMVSINGHKLIIINFTNVFCAISRCFLKFFAEILRYFYKFLMKNKRLSFCWLTHSNEDNRDVG